MHNRLKMLDKSVQTNLADINNMLNYNPLI